MVAQKTMHTCEGILVFYSFNVFIYIDICCPVFLQILFVSLNMHATCSKLPFNILAKLELLFSRIKCLVFSTSILSLIAKFIFLLGIYRISGHFISIIRPDIKIYIRSIPTLYNNNFNNLTTA